MHIEPKKAHCPETQGDRIMKQAHIGLINTLKKYTNDLTVKDHNNPVILNLNGKDISVYIGNLGELTKEPGNVRHSPSKANIDIQRDRHKSGTKVAFIGVFGGEKNYCAWSLQHIFSLRAMTKSTLRAPRSYEKAKLDYPIIHKKNKHILIIMPSFSLGPYLENTRDFHSLVDESEPIRSLPDRDSISLEDLPGHHPTNSEKRKQFVSLWKKFRDPNFRKKVMRAYDNACCICGFQLTLDAAHIIPHENEESRDIVTNGLLLCPNHHRMYDKSLFSINADYKIIVEHDLIDRLRRKGRSGGIDDLVNREGDEISLPKNERNWPSKEFLRYSDTLRTKT